MTLLQNWSAETSAGHSNLRLVKNIFAAILRNTLRKQCCTTYLFDSRRNRTWFKEPWWRSCIALLGDNFVKHAYDSYQILFKSFWNIDQCFYRWTLVQVTFRLEARDSWHEESPWCSCRLLLRAASRLSDGFAVLSVRGMEWPSLQCHSFGHALGSDSWGLEMVEKPLIRETPKIESIEKA